MAARVLPDEAVVVRGGRMEDLEALKQSAADYHAKTGTFGLSVCSLPDLRAEEIARAVPEGRLPHTMIRESTVGALRRLGYDVVPGGWHGHATLKLPNPPTDGDWDNLLTAFGEPEANPVARTSRG